MAKFYSVLIFALVLFDPEASLLVIFLVKVKEDVSITYIRTINNLVKMSNVLLFVL